MLRDVYILVGHKIDTECASAIEVKRVAMSVTPHTLLGSLQTAHGWSRLWTRIMPFLEVSIFYPIR